jgi:hypothetical protein
MLRLAGLIPAAVLVALMFVVPTYAQQATSSGWYTLAPGQTVEWDMTYPGNGNPTNNYTATLEVAESPTNAVQVRVWTDTQWLQMAGGQTVTEVGDGTQSMGANNTLLYNGDLLWQTGTPSNEYYHIQFTNATQQNASYHITLSGAAWIAPFKVATVAQ